jgi:hypothetical protein
MLLPLFLLALACVLPCAMAGYSCPEWVHMDPFDCPSLPPSAPATGSHSQSLFSAAYACMLLCITRTQTLMLYNANAFYRTLTLTHTLTHAHTHTDINHLAPGDIAAVMSVGDSITAGFAMLDEPMEYRGLSYSTGQHGGQWVVSSGLWVVGSA